MGFDSIFHYFNLTLEIFFLDVLLSGDNAVMIALACRTLPPVQMRHALLIGTGVAIVLRILLTTVASLLLSIPMLKLVGGAALVVIAIKLIIEEDNAAEPVGNPEEPNDTGLWSAIGTIIVADIVMSVDNVLGLAAVTQGSTMFLVLGVLMSVPLLMYGSPFVCALLRRYPLLIQGGGALLGWVAGDIAISDPMIVDWVNQQAPALTVVVPVLGTVFVLRESRIMQGTRSTAVLLRPGRVPVNALSAAIKATLIRSIVVVSSLFVTTVVPPIATDEGVRVPRNLEPTATPPVSDSTKEHSPALRSHRFTFSGGARWMSVALSIPLLAGIFFLFDYASVHWLSDPAESKRYFCSEADAFVYYLPGGNTIRMHSSFGFGSITGIVDQYNIDWGDYSAATKTLGFLPPTSVQYGDAKWVRLNGGLHSGIECLAQPATSPTP